MERHGFGSKQTSAPYKANRLLIHRQTQGVRLRTALSSSAPSGCHQQHKEITERKMRRCHQNRLYVHSHEVQRDQTPVTARGGLSQPQAAEPPPQGPSLAGLGAPGTPQHHLTGVRTTEAGEQSPSCCFLDPDHGQSTPCPVLGAPPGHFRGVQHVSALLCSQPADRSLTFPKPHQQRYSWARRKRPGETRPLHTSTCELAAGPALIT